MDKLQLEMILQSGYWQGSELVDIVLEEGIAGVGIEVTGQDHAYGWRLTNEDGNHLKSTEQFRTPQEAKANMRHTLEQIRSTQS